MQTCSPLFISHQTVLPENPLLSLAVVVPPTKYNKPPRPTNAPARTAISADQWRPDRNVCQLQDLSPNQRTPPVRRFETEEVTTP